MNLSIPCPCPGSPHPDGDTLTFRDKLDFERAMTVRNEIVRLVRARPGQSAALASITKTFAIVGLESWTVVDDKGKPREPTPIAIADTLEGLDILAASEIADQLDELYAERYVLPLVREAPTSSPPTSTDELTSAPTESEESPVSVTPSSQSSTFITPTDATVRTSLSLVGASN